VNMVEIRERILSRKRMMLVATAAFALAIGTFSVQAQAPNPAGANAEKHGIAVVDVSYIFKQHARFRATMDSMKKQMEGIEAELKADRDKIAQTEQQRNTFNPGSAEYKQYDEEVARMMADFNVKMTR
jgi:Skp family chaperone for outer membrane proteins